jgi:hypothetical protein
VERSGTTELPSAGITTNASSPIAGITTMHRHSTRDPPHLKRRKPSAADLAEIGGVPKTCQAPESVQNSATDRKQSKNSVEKSLHVNSTQLARLK